MDEVLRVGPYDGVNKLTRRDTRNLCSCPLSPLSLCYVRTQLEDIIPSPVQAPASLSSRPPQFSLPQHNVLNEFRLSQNWRRGGLEATSETPTFWRPGMPTGTGGRKRESQRLQAQSLDLLSLSIHSVGEIHPCADDVHIYISS